jgi:hypothetical protein
MYLGRDSVSIKYCCFYNRPFLCHILYLVYFNIKNTIIICLTVRTDFFSYTNSTATYGKKMGAVYIQYRPEIKCIGYSEQAAMNFFIHLAIISKNMFSHKCLTVAKDVSERAYPVLFIIVICDKIQLFDKNKSTCTKCHLIFE